MKKLAVAAVLLGSVTVFGQTKTETDCQKNGDTMHCTSTEKDGRTQGQINADAFKAGWEMGRPLGDSLHAAREARAFDREVDSYCAMHPGEDWHNSNGQSGHCQTDNERLVARYMALEARHHEFNARDLDNMKTVCDYMEAQNYNPNSEKGWEKAYRELKKQKRLKLYAKGSY